MNGYYKAELFRGPARHSPWKTVEGVELATLGWVFWHNTSRLHSYLGDLPPTEYEQAYYAAEQSDPEDIGIQPPRLYETQSGSDRLDHDPLSDGLSEFFKPLSETLGNPQPTRPEPF